MYSEGRLTRSRARTLQEQGQTPLVAFPADGKTPATRRTGRKAAAKDAEAPTPRAALFDVTNSSSDEVPAATVELPPLDETQPVEFEQDQPNTMQEEPGIEEADAVTVVAQQEDNEAEEGEIVECPAAVEAPSAVQPPLEEQAPLAPEESAESAPAAAAEEPPATPPPAPMPSSAEMGPGPTPTGLGLSGMAPMSPLGPTIAINANTPAVTPLHGVPAGTPQQAKVFSMLNAAAQAFAQQAAVEQELEAPAAGFGSPVKYSESPAMSVSLAGTISLRDGMEGVEQEEEGEQEVCSSSPAGAYACVASPAMNLGAELAADIPAVAQSPVLKQSPARAVPVRAHASPVGFAVQEAEYEEEYYEEVDYGEDCNEEEEEMAEETFSIAAALAPVEAVAVDASKPRLQSKVVVASPYDPRSLRQLKKEIKHKMEEREAASAANSEEEEEYDAAEGEEGGNLLADALGALNLGSPEHGAALGPYELYGMPKPQGQHIRFCDDGSEYVSPRLKTMLRGMPTPHGKHMFFDDDE